jgi:hypothetical protein
MAGKGHTPARSIRIPDDEWRAAQQRAAERGETLTDVIRRALKRYAARSTTQVREGIE